MLIHAQNEVLIPTRHLPGGQYVCNIFADNKIAETQQFTIVK